MTFNLSGGRYAFDIRVLTEIYPNVDITPVPRSAPQIRGLVNIRGHVVLVIDIAVLFGMEQRPITDESMIVALKTHREINVVDGMKDHPEAHYYGDKTTAFLVDSIGETLEIDDEAIEPPPLHLDEKNAEFIEGVINREGSVLVVLNAGKIAREPRIGGGVWSR